MVPAGLSQRSGLNLDAVSLKDHFFSRLFSASETERRRRGREGPEDGPVTTSEDVKDEDCRLGNTPL